ncbi:hypothetical protein F5148DRAFT_1350715 [Russula earlei]|uniref:Uncharacterized protein n=1 Tax=Russula earlei TaxID=71964 RepID=A0ACC0TSB2_9AGAM|nr:hypothetical protein F5148DRAFT_1350715 [Russula earlei]
MWVWCGKAGGVVCLQHVKCVITPVVLPSVGHIGAVAAAIDTEAMVVARARVVVREGGGVERHGHGGVTCMLLMLSSCGHGNEVFATAGGGSTCGCNGRGGKVWCGACVGGMSCGNAVVVGSNYSVGQHCGICFSEVAAIMARDGSVRAAWSGSRVVAGTRPGMVVDEAEGMVAMTVCAGDMVDVTKEAEAEAAEDETGTEMGDEEAAVGIDVMVGVDDVETGEESVGVNDAEKVASQTEMVVWDGAVIGGTCMVTMEMAGSETTEAAMGDIGEVAAAGDTTEGMGVASHHGYVEFLMLDPWVGMN